MTGLWSLPVLPRWGATALLQCLLCCLFVIVLVVIHLSWKNVNFMLFPMLCTQWKTCISNYLLYSNWIIMASWSKGNYLTFPFSWDLHNDDEYPILLNLLFSNLLILLFVVLGSCEGQACTLPWRNSPSPIMLYIDGLQGLCHGIFGIKVMLIYPLCQRF